MRCKDDVLGLASSTLLAQHTPADVLAAAATAAGEALEYVGCLTFYKRSSSQAVTCV